MKTLRITGVPEHFNLPWKNIIAKQPFSSRGVKLEWIEESRGSGQMNKAIRNDETDMALILTESFLQDFENGSPSKMIGFHVLSPLVWGVHIHGQSLINSLSEIENPSFLISRMGSGSQLMSYVLAKRENWNQNNLNFKIVGNLPGALEEMSADKPQLFLWEKFTTKPWVDSGDLKRIGEVPSPWPCFVMLASLKALDSFKDLILELRDLVYQESNKLQSSHSTSTEISTLYKLKKEDVEQWMAQTQWAANSEISTSQLEKAIKEMVSLGILKSELRLEEFLIPDGIQLVR
ncbi:ABC transporter substrate-binding protein [Algoriphagus sp. SE2]|uniref:ABC transporter substrate-binding protein n=1 Tax=Algoriphagus sp. SE2 TaxID=3141536 RepID=UPI0031CD4F10